MFDIFHVTFIINPVIKCYVALDTDLEVDLCEFYHLFPVYLATCYRFIYFYLSRFISRKTSLLVIN